LLPDAFVLAVPAAGPVLAALTLTATTRQVIDCASAILGGTSPQHDHFAKGGAR
jgi:hypothetical protein